MRHIVQLSILAALISLFFSFNGADQVEAARDSELFFQSSQAVTLTAVSAEENADRFMDQVSATYGRAREKALQWVGRVHAFFW
jgi:hypothetical protein